MRHWHYEQGGQPLLDRASFLKRLTSHVGAALALVAVALAIGMAGYRGLEKSSWLDAFLSAAMILSGMGPTAVIRTSGGKLFAGLYALFSGVVFLVVAGVLFAPIAHRILHRFHLDEDL